MDFFKPIVRIVTQKLNESAVAVPAPTVSRGEMASGQIVRRDFRSLLMERGWERRGGSYFGFYRTKHGSYSGRIVCRSMGPTSFYISDPPDCLWKHSHALCFIPKGGKNYEVHFAKSGKTLDDGILAIEKILLESHGL